jgi:hypothetical protein
VISSSSRDAASPDWPSADTTESASAGLRNWRGGKIDGDRQVRRPRRRVTAGLLEHPIAERHDQADLFGDRNECVRRDHAAFRMVPAQQRFETRDFAGRDFDQRLIAEFELIGEERLAQIKLQPVAFLHVRIHIRLEEVIGAAAFGLGAIERPSSCLARE